MRRATVMRIYKEEIISSLRLLQLSDSALPIGSFSFSATIETAVSEAVVHNAATLSDYLHAVLVQSAHTDGLAALHAFRAAEVSDYSALPAIDRRILAFRLNSEGRTMLCRMGRKLAELGATLISDSIMTRWIEDIRSGATPGTHPIALALVCHAVGLREEDMFCSHSYGVASMILNAALRCAKVSHIETQRILYDMADTAVQLYEEVRELNIEDMNSFAPQIDILAAMHETGDSRMFMS